MGRPLQQNRVRLAREVHAGQPGHAGLDGQRLPFFDVWYFHGHSTLAGRSSGRNTFGRQAMDLGPAQVQLWKKIPPIYSKRCRNLREGVNI